MGPRARKKAVFGGAGPTGPSMFMRWPAGPMTFVTIGLGPPLFWDLGKSDAKSPVFMRWPTRDVLKTIPGATGPPCPVLPGGARCCLLSPFLRKCSHGTRLNIDVQDSTGSAGHSLPGMRHAATIPGPAQLVCLTEGWGSGLRPAPQKTTPPRHIMEGIQRSQNPKRALESSLFFGSTIALTGK
jgi:hypothetical protein